MSNIRTIIQAVDSQSEEYGVYLPNHAVNFLKIPASTLTIAFGSQETQGTVVRRTDGRATQITVSLLRRLRLPVGMPILLRYDSIRRRLVFGPYVGVLLAKHNGPNSSMPFAGISTFMNEISDVCYEKGGVIGVFTPQDIDWGNQTVRALVRKRASWRSYTLPLPQCIYNRLPTRQYEQKEQVGASIQRFKDLHIPFFNDQFLNKWHVHDALSKEEQTNAYLPKTVRLFGAHDLKQMLNDHRMVYVKPTSGSMGRGIYRINKTTNGFQLQYATMNGSVTRSYPDIPALYQALRKSIQGTHYLLQQGLVLIGVKRKPADFRVLVQKNQRGEWAVTSLVARLGQNHIVSNVARGGMMTKPDQALRIAGPWVGSIRPSVQSLKNVALQVADTLERVLTGHYAEFGVDLGVDVNGRIWLLEVNSKPSKSDSTIQRPEGEGEEVSTYKIRPSVRRLYEYSSYLSGYVASNNPPSAKQKKVKRKRQRR